MMHILTSALEENASIESHGLGSRLQPTLLADLTLRDLDFPLSDPR